MHIPLQKFGKHRDFSKFDTVKQLESTLSDLYIDLEEDFRSAIMHNYVLVYSICFATQVCTWIKLKSVASPSTPM